MAPRVLGSRSAHLSLGRGAEGSYDLLAPAARGRGGSGDPKVRCTGPVPEKSPRVSALRTRSNLRFDIDQVVPSDASHSGRRVK